jgi:hypothetical protein
MKMGFKQNKHDLCVYNKKMKDGVVTIQVHIDDLKISSRSKKQLTNTLVAMRMIYGEIKVHEGFEHDYLGMLMSYNPEDQSIRIDMKNYVEGCIDEFKQGMPGVELKDVATPATDNLFKVRKQGDAGLITTTKAKIFHSTVKKLLFLAKWGKPDILLAVSFLTTIVKNLDEDDWKKLIRVQSYFVR